MNSNTITQIIGFLNIGNGKGMLLIGWLIHLIIKSDIPYFFRFIKFVYVCYCVTVLSKAVKKEATSQ